MIVTKKLFIQARFVTKNMVESVVIAENLTHETRRS